MGRPKLGLERITIGVPPELLAELDAVAGSMNRADMIRCLIEEGLHRRHEKPVPMATVSVPRDRGDRPARVPEVRVPAPVQRLKINIPSEDAEAVEQRRAEKAARGAMDHPQWGDHNRRVLDAVRLRPGNGVRVLAAVSGLGELPVERALERLSGAGLVRWERGVAVLA